MRDIVITLIVFGLVPYILVRPYVGILAFSWISYMNPHRLSWGFAYNMPFALVLAAATLASLVFSREKVRIPWTPTTVIWIAFILWMCLTTVFALNMDGAITAWTRVIKIQFMAFLTLALITTRERLIALVWVIAGSIGFYGVKGGLFAVLTGGNSRVWGPPGSFIEGNNELGLALIMILPLMRFLQLRSTHKLVHWGFTGAMLVTVLAILSTHSRGALLASAAMLVFLWLRSKRKLWFGLALVIVAPLLFTFMPQKWHDRMATIETYEEDTSAMSRFAAWQFGYEMASARFLGGGFESFVAENYRRYAPEVADSPALQPYVQRNGIYPVAHSIYFSILGEHGFVGLALFLALGFSAWLNAAWIRKHARGDGELAWAADLASMLEAGLIGFAVGGSFLSLQYFDLPYHFIAMLVILRLLVQKHLAETRSEKSYALPSSAFA